MLIYRVEGAKGYGPNGPRDYPGYPDVAGAPWMRMFAGNWEFPAPTADPHRVGDRPVQIDWMDHDLAISDVCGVSSLRQLRRWFDKSDRVYLSQYGFAVKVYDVPEKDVSILRTQVTFNKSAAHLVETLDVVDLHPISADEAQPLLEKAA